MLSQSCRSTQIDSRAEHTAKNSTIYWREGALGRIDMKKIVSCAACPVYQQPLSHGQSKPVWQVHIGT